MVYSASADLGRFLAFLRIAAWGHAGAPNEGAAAEPAVCLKGLRHLQEASVPANSLSPPPPATQLDLPPPMICTLLARILSRRRKPPWWPEGYLSITACRDSVPVCFFDFPVSCFGRLGKKNARHSFLVIPVWHGWLEFNFYRVFLCGGSRTSECVCVLRAVFECLRVEGE